MKSAFRPIRFTCGFTAVTVAAGRQRQESPLPAPPATGGISISQSEVFVACEDGTILCFTAR